jgi:hypothetical protein
VIHRFILHPAIVRSLAMSSTKRKLSYDSLPSKRPRTNEQPTMMRYFRGQLIEWRLNGNLHRVDGPSLYDAEGTFEHWFLDGARHREDGPAVRTPTGRLEWRILGNLHRIDGPAIITGDGDKEWWIWSTQYTKEEYERKVASLKKLFGSLKMKRFLQLTRRNKQFVESFYAEGGMGRKWDFARLERETLVR